MTTPQGQTLPLRVSIGGHLASDGDDLESVLHHGDEALDQAKQGGRNRYQASRRSDSGGTSPTDAAAS